MPPEEAERPYSHAELAIVDKLRRKAIVGSAEQVAVRLKELAKSLELDELVVVTWTYDPRRAIVPTNCWRKPSDLKRPILGRRKRYLPK